MSVLLSITEFIGRFHPVLVHLPIGILLTGLFLQLLASRKRYQISQDVIRIVLLTGMGTALIACITGYLLSLNGDYEGNTVALHMWMGIGVAACSMLLCVKVINGQNDRTQRLASLALLVLIVITGHLGGTLTHGADYLTAALYQAPDKVKKVKPIANVQEALVYNDLVAPLLDADCSSCHGAQKQKGGLRIDDIGGLLKGGKDGAVLVYGRADKSELFKRLMLPKDDEHHMPPKQKPQLNEKQLALLHWWIDNGCDFTKKVKDLPQDNKMRAILLSFQSDHIRHVVADEVPATDVAPADGKAVERLRKTGVVVMPVAQGSHYIMADYVTASHVKDLSLLQPLAKQLVWLNVGSSDIGDSALRDLARLAQLRKLYLDNTHITDKGIRFLSGLDSLRYLNLVGTGVSGAGVLELKGLKKLQELYLYKTAVDHRQWGALQRQLPHVRLDSGGYSLPKLVTDTAVVRR